MGADIKEIVNFKRKTDIEDLEPVFENLCLEFPGKKQLQE